MAARAQGQLKGKGVVAFAVANGSTVFYQATREEVMENKRTQRGSSLYVVADEAVSRHHSHASSGVHAMPGRCLGCARSSARLPTTAQRTRIPYGIHPCASGVHIRS